jgi:hypothetical protein
VGKPEGKRPLGRPSCRWGDGVRMDLREIGLGGVDWIRLSQDRDRWRAVVSALINLRVLAPWSWLVSYVDFEYSSDNWRSIGHRVLLSFKPI